VKEVKSSLAQSTHLTVQTIPEVRTVLYSAVLSSHSGCAWAEVCSVGCVWAQVGHTACMPPTDVCLLWVCHLQVSVCCAACHLQVTVCCAYATYRCLSVARMPPTGVCLLCVCHLQVSVCCAYATYRCLSVARMTPTGVCLLRVCHLQVSVCCAYATYRCLSVARMTPTGVCLLRVCHLQVSLLRVPCPCRCAPRCTQGGTTCGRVVSEYRNEKITVQLAPGNMPPASLTRSHAEKPAPCLRRPSGPGRGANVAPVTVSSDTTVWKLKLLVWEALEVSFVLTILSAPN